MVRTAVKCTANEGTEFRFASVHKTEPATEEPLVPTLRGELLLIVNDAETQNEFTVGKEYTLDIWPTGK